MKNIPDMLFVVDTNKESIAIKEAKKIGIPVVAVLDTNSSTDGLTFQYQEMTTLQELYHCTVI